jgi:hypothetical protein
VSSTIRVFRLRKERRESAVWRRARAFASLSAAAVGLALLPSARSQNLPGVTQQQIRALLSEKASRNPAQVKMDSHLVHAAQILRGHPVSPGFPTPPGELESVNLDANNFVEVDIRADVSSELLTLIRSVGGSVVNAFPERQTLRARLPLLSVERIAGRNEVRQIRLAAQAAVSAAAEGPDSYGDIAHQANAARLNFGFNGAGVTVGVISNGVNSLAAEQTKGNLPATVNVISGQAGSGDEGTALLEIVYTLAPGAALYFATGDGSEAQMAANIQALAAAGCNIILDDLTYFSEGVYQDDVIAQAVDSVTASGVFYFSAAGNSGSLRAANSGTWQGDFVDSGTTFSDNSVLVAVHSFGAANYDTLTMPSMVFVPGGEGVYELMWSDPLGQSNNDYDLFITDSSGNVLASSTNVQNGTQDPEEAILGSSAFFDTCAAGTCQILIVKHPDAAARALFLSTERGNLSIATAGATYGHAAAASAFGVAASNAEYAIPQYYPSCSGFSMSCNGGVESFSSDGPRQMFYNRDGSAITPGNFLIGTGGGSVLNKPDLTAADDVNTGVPGYTSFAGTSAATAHAAAVAALLLEAVPTLTPAAMSAALSASAVDIQNLPDINVGAGVAMAPAAIAAACGYSLGALPLISASGGAAGLSIQAGQNCPWAIAGLPSWVSGATSGAGPATVSLTIAANSGAVRSAAFSLTAGALTLASASIAQDAFAPASQTITFGALSSVTYDASPFTLAATATSGLPVTFASATTSVCAVSGSTVTVLAAGACSITASQPGNASYAAATPVTQAFAVSPASQTIAFAPLANLTYGAAAFTLTATATSGLSVTFASTTNSVCAVSGSTVTVLAAGACSITASQPGNANYAAATPVTQAFAVSPASQTIAFAPLANLTYGAAPFTPAATATSGLSVTFASTTNSVCAVSGSTVTVLAAGSCSIVASQPGNANYTAATPVTQTFAVNPASQTIAFAPLANKTFGAAAFTVSATASSGLTVTFGSATTSVCTVSTNRVTIAAAGLCSVVASQPGNANYAAAAPVTQSFTVNPASQTIAFGSLASVTLGVAPFNLSATASSGLAVSFASATTPVCTVSGVTVTVRAAGTCSITASQAGNADYSAATPVTQSFTVNRDQRY